MFSSLPSASKIYVSSSKPRQKRSASSKGKKKRVQSTSSHVCVSTLVSQIDSDYDCQNVESSSETCSDIHHTVVEDTSISDALFPGNALPEDSVVEIQMISDNNLADLVLEQCQNNTSMVKNGLENENSCEHSAEVNSAVSVITSTGHLNVESVSENVTTENLNEECLSENVIVVNSDIENITIDDLVVENISENVREANPNEVLLKSAPTDDIECLSRNEKEENFTIESSVANNFDEVISLSVDIQNVSTNSCSESLTPSSINETKLETEKHNGEDVSGCVTIEFETESSNAIEKSISNCVTLQNVHEDVSPETSTAPIDVLLPNEPGIENHCDGTDVPNGTNPLKTQGNNNLEGETERSPSPEHSEMSGTESVLYESKSSSLVFENKSEDATNCVLVAEKIPLNSIDTCQSYSDLGIIQTSSSDLKRCSSFPKSLKEISEKAPNLNVLDKATFTADFPCQYCGSDERLLQGQNDSKITSEAEKTLSFNLTSTGVSANLERESSQNGLPPLTTAHARARSYVFGSTGHLGSLLGSEELIRFFPDSQVTIFVGTWNMNSHNPPQNIDDFLLPLDVHSLPDIYAIGVQESMQSKFEWDVLVQSTLGPSHVLFASSSLGVLHLSVYIRRDLIWFCSEPEDANVATRPGTMVKTKGAVAVCFMFFGTSLLFVNSHLAAHEQKLKERLLDYEKICSSLDLPKSIPLKANQRDKDVTSRFDVVLWCGDLNFRVTRDRPSVLSFVEQRLYKSRPSCSFLVKHDQLYKAMQEGAAFHGFKEGVIHFNPSYKFDVGTNTFNSTKLRVPSYTDRILYRSNDRSSVTCLHYDAVPDILTSDHKPVFGVFKITLRPGRDNVPLAAGMFKRDIYLEAIKRRTQFLGVHQGQSTICTIM